MIHEDDAVGISYRQAGGFIFFGIKYKRLVDHFPDLSGYRDLSGQERGFSHFYPKLCSPAVQTFHLYRSSQGLNAELPVFHISVIHKIFCEDPYAVTADGRLASVRVIDANAHFAVDIHRPVKNAVRAQTESPLAHQGDLLSLKMRSVLVWIQHQIIVPQSLIFHHHHTVRHYLYPPLSHLITLKHSGIPAFRGCFHHIISLLYPFIFQCI